MPVQALTVEKKASRRSVLEHIQSKAFETCLATSFTEAACAAAAPACVALAHGCATYVAALYAQASPEMM